MSHVTRHKPTHHGGPVSKLPRPAPKRGLKQSEKLPNGPVVTVVQNGRIVTNKRFERAINFAAVTELSPQPCVSASATPPRLLGRGGIPAKSEPPTRETPKDEST